MKTLSITECQIVPDISFKELFDAIRHNTSLTMFDISDNLLMRKHVTVLLNAILPRVANGTKVYKIDEIGRVRTADRDLSRPINKSIKNLLIYGNHISTLICDTKWWKRVALSSLQSLGLFRSSVELRFPMDFVVSNVEHARGLLHGLRIAKNVKNIGHICATNDVITDIRNLLKIRNQHPDTKINDINTTSFDGKGSLMSRDYKNMTTELGAFTETDDTVIVDGKTSGGEPIRWCDVKGYFGRESHTNPASVSGFLAYVNDSTKILPKKRDRRAAENIDTRSEATLKRRKHEENNNQQDVTMPIKCERGAAYRDDRAMLHDQANRNKEVVHGGDSMVPNNRIRRKKKTRLQE